MSNVARANSRELELQCLLDKYSPHLVILTEVELPVKDDTFSVPNYSVMYPEPVGNKYRLLVLVQAELVLLYSPTVIYKSHLDIWVKLVTPLGNMVVGGVYRQWGEAEDEELALIHSHFVNVGSNYSRAIVLGDMNLAICRKEDPTYYRKMLLQQHLQQMEAAGFEFVGPHTPTFTSYGRFRDNNGIMDHKRSILDHVYTLQGGEGDVNVEVLPDSLTDHLPVIARLRLQPPRSGYRQVRMRNYKSLSGSSLIMAINAKKLSEVYYMDDVDDAHAAIVEEIVQALDIVAPSKLKSVKNRPTPLHLKPDTLKTMQERDKAATSGNHAKFRVLRNRAVHLVRRDRLETNARFIEEAQGNPSKVWTLANSVMGRNSRMGLPRKMVDDNGVSISGDEALANHMNTFFLDKIDRLRKGVEKERENSDDEGDSSSSRSNSSSGSSGNCSIGMNSFQFHMPTEQATYRMIMGLKNTKAEGVDKIPVLVLKLAAPVIAGPISHLVRLSLSTSKIPKAFKLANVTPLHKGKSKPANSASSYRPVSILPALSKVLERAVLRQLNEYVDSKMPNVQFGFRPRRSTTAAIVTAHSSWCHAKAAGKVVGIAAYDLSAAFDTLDHAKVIDKLRRMGVGSKERLWFLNYLSGRKQRVLYRDSASKYRDVRFGVPQGSILGPLLFLCLIMDLPDAIYSSNCNSLIGCSGYADDTVAWCVGRTVEEVQKDLEVVSASVAKYMVQHNLVLNRDKTQVLLTGSSGGSSSSSVIIDGVNVIPGDNLELLGVRFNKQLAPTPHLEATCAAARSIACAARRLSLHLPQASLQQVLQALIMGKLGYGCAVITPRFREEDPLPVLHHKIQTSINNCARSTIGSILQEHKSVEELLDETGYPSLNRLIIRTVALEAWKAIRCRIGPAATLGPVGELLCPDDAQPGPATAAAAISAAAATATAGATTRRATRSTAAGKLKPPAKFRVKSFSWAAMEIWNGAPNLRAASTMSAAKAAAAAFAKTVPI